MKKIMIFCDDSFLQFRVHLDPFFIKISRFHTLQQEKLVTKVIISLLGPLDRSTSIGNSKHPPTSASDRHEFAIQSVKNNV